MKKIVQRITPFLWFNTQAEEAVNFYVSVFQDSKITAVSRYGESGPGPKGTVMTIRFLLAGQEFVALNGGPIFTFNEALSFVVNCETQGEVDGFWEKLSQGGQVIGCGWLKDKYGLCWQIVPIEFISMASDPDPIKSQRVMQAMMKMKKLEIEPLRRAYEGN